MKNAPREHAQERIVKSGIEYRVNPRIGARDFVDLLNRSTLGERRPVDEPDCMQGMLDHCSLLVAAYDGDKLVGVARSLTDFHYCCYLSDLAVDAACQKRGIGRELIRQTQAQLKDKCKIILLAAPKAVDYYPRIGFDHHPQAWILTPPAAKTRKP